MQGEQAMPPQIILFQLSDLHVGEEMDLIGQHWLSGLNAHDVQLAIRLRPTIEAAKRWIGIGSQEAFAVVSGDLTATGKRGEFSNAHTLLRSRWQLDVHRVAGCEFSSQQLFCIPGNHDHWNGVGLALPPAFNGAIARHFSGSAWVHELRSPDDKFALELLGIDSNAGLEGTATNLRAGGKYADADLDVLRERMEVNQSKRRLDLPVVRALVSHHGINTTVPRGAWYKPEAKQLSLASQQELLELAGEYDIHMLLTGHLHSTHAAQHSAPYRGYEHVLREIRCSTTLQAPRSDRRQGFLMHQVLSVPAGIRWNTFRFDWIGSRFYCPSTPWISFTL